MASPVEIESGPMMKTITKYVSCWRALYPKNPFGSGGNRRFA